MGISPGSSQEFAKAYVERITTLLAALDIKQVARVIDLLLDARTTRRNYFLYGKRRERGNSSAFCQ